MAKSKTYETIWNVIRKIPFGSVATYGQIAELSGMDGQYRLIGYALHALGSDTDVPWHRVINSKGRISLPGPSARRQRRKLEAEKIKFDRSGKIDFKKYRWKG